METFNFILRGWPPPDNNHTSGREPFVPEHNDRLASTESLQHRLLSLISYKICSLCHYVNSRIREQ